MNKLGKTTKFDSEDEENLRNISKVVQVAVQHCFAPPDTKKESIINQLKQHTTCPTKHQVTSQTLNLNNNTRQHHITNL